MKISELSRESGVPVASIKWFKREGLLPEGHATSATMVEYGPDHVKRLRLIKALTTIGGLSIAGTREVLVAIDEARSPAQTLKAVSYAMSVSVGAHTGSADEDGDGDAVESYLGLPSFDTKGMVIGHLACRDRKPMEGELPHDAVLRLFAARGYEQTTINDIAEAAEVAPHSVMKSSFVGKYPVTV